MATGAFTAEWEALAPPFRRCLELADRSRRRGGLAVGAAVTDGTGVIITAGRNRAYDPAGGPDPLQRTPIAHAEMNALAGLDVDHDLDTCMIWSSHQPCSMCQAAIAFIGLPPARVLAPDPSDEGPPAPTLGSDVWVVAANVLFLASIAEHYGTAGALFDRQRAVEPETVDCTAALLGSGAMSAEEGTLTSLLGAVWDELATAATRRSARR